MKMYMKKEKIPKVIHYCWFGHNPLPDLAIKCIDSWKKYCPDYEIVEWNEDNFNLKCNTYIKEAYEAKKWAFITDYVRLFVLYNYGGIYMDTDVELVKPIDDFLSLDSFSGFESSNAIPTGIMASCKKQKIFKEFLNYYNNRHFIKEDGTYDLTTNVVTITNICLEKGLIINNKYQKIDGFVLFPNDYFCPKDYLTGDIIMTNNTHAIHHFSGSWIPEFDKKMMLLERRCKKIFGNRTGHITYLIISFPIRTGHFFIRNGFRNTIKKIGNKCKRRH